LAVKELLVRLARLERWAQLERLAQRVQLTAFAGLIAR
jgi:hypothetical protein